MTGAGFGDGRSEQSCQELLLLPQAERVIAGPCEQRLTLTQADCRAIAGVTREVLAGASA